jgi:hypothetical protein
MIRPSFQMPLSTQKLAGLMLNRVVSIMMSRVSDNSDLIVHAISPIHISTQYFPRCFLPKLQTICSILNSQAVLSPIVHALSIAQRDSLIVCQVRWGKETKKGKLDGNI